MVHVKSFHESIVMALSSRKIGRERQRKEFPHVRIAPHDAPRVADWKVILAIVRGFVAHCQDAVIEIAATLGIRIDALLICSKGIIERAQLHFVPLCRTETIAG